MRWENSASRTGGAKTASALARANVLLVFFAAKALRDAVMQTVACSVFNLQTRFCAASPQNSWNGICYAFSRRL